MGRMDNFSPIDYSELVEEDRIHGSLYIDENVYNDEMDRIFHQGWVFVGHDSEIPNVGDYVTRMVGKQSVIMMRGKDKTVRVFLNRCQHRGNQLCNEKQGNKRALACPYHGWAYNTEGELKDVPFKGGFDKPLEDFNLEQPRTDAYRGFVWACLAEEGISLLEHLGRSTELFDRACGLSPDGELNLTAGWDRHRYLSNWKMLPENDTDGYHVNFTHRSFVEAIDSQYNDFVNEEETIEGVVIDWGMGHTEIDFSKGYKEPLKWLGVSESRVPEYVEAMKASYGEEEAMERLRVGPPHACIFPNLFLGEMNIVIFQPEAVGGCVQWHTPMLLKGAEQLNYRLLRQSEGAMGPASFLVADDATIAQLTQRTLEQGQPWCDLSRGMGREVEEPNGNLVSHMTDETNNRGFWKHYKKVMEG